MKINSTLHGQPLVPVRRLHHHRLGDITPVTFPGRAVTILITFYEIVLVAILSGVVVSFYIELINRRDKDTLKAFLDRVEHVSELSHEELVEMEENVKRFRL